MGCGVEKPKHEVVAKTFEAFYDLQVPGQGRHVPPFWRKLFKKRLKTPPLGAALHRYVAEICGDGSWLATATLPRGRVLLQFCSCCITAAPNFQWLWRCGG